MMGKKKTFNIQHSTLNAEHRMKAKNTPPCSFALAATEGRPQAPNKN